MPHNEPEIIVCTIFWAKNCPGNARVEHQESKKINRTEAFLYEVVW